MRCFGSHLGLFASAFVVSSAIAQSQPLGWGRNNQGQTRPGLTPLLGHKRVSACGATSVAVRTDGTVVAWGVNGFGQTTVPADLSGVVQATTSGNHTLALKGDGTLVGWGLNGFGQATSPPGLADVTQLAVGGDHSLALRRDGSIVGWGSNQQAQATVPPGLEPSKWIAAAQNYSLAVTRRGTVSVWGSTGFGQASVPPDLAGVDDAATGARHVLARRRDGVVIGWGSDTSGQASVPASLSGVVQVAAGWSHSLALRSDGTIAGWGSDSYGECRVPTGEGPFVEVAAGEVFSVAVLRDGRVLAWGYNGNGQADAPARLPRLLDLDCGDYQVVAATSEGGVVAWGYNGFGQTDVPAGLAQVVKVAAGDTHSLAMRADGSVVGWGSNTRGQCNVPGDLVAVQIAADGYHSVALRSAGTVACWGFNGYGQLNVPAGLSGIVQVDTGDGHVVALSSAGLVRAWGWNQSGQATVPAGLTGIIHIGAGKTHTLAVRQDGSVAAWGSNTAGQLEVPAGLTGVVAVSGGEAHSVALRGDGTVVAWGAGTVDTGIAPNYGQSVVPSSLAGVTKVSAGLWNTMVLLEPGISACANPAGSGRAVLAVSGTAWQEVGAWRWLDATGPQVPGPGAQVDLGSYGSVGSDCEAQAWELTTGAGTSILVPAAASVPGDDLSIRVGATAQLAGRLWLLGVAGGAGVLPTDLDVPVLSAGNLEGSFDLIESEVPPPAGYFLTLVPSDVNGRTMLSLKLLALPGNAELSGASTGAYAGTAVAAETIDINHDGFDDLALAIDFGAGQPGLVQVLLNDGAGNLGGTSVLEQTPAQPTCMTVGEVNGDGRVDVVVGLGSDHTARVYLADGQGGLVPGTVIGPVASTPTAVIVIPPAGAAWRPSSSSVGVGTSDAKMSIYLDGSLQQELVMAGTVETVRGGDTGGRSGTDIVTGGAKSADFTMMPAPETGFVQVLRRQASGLFVISQTMEITAKPVGMDVADLDGDGLDDIVTANADPVLPASGGSLPVLSIFRNTNGTFGGGVPYQPAGASSALSVSLVDADHDGDRDIVSVHRTIASESEAALLRVDTLGAGTPISIGQTTVLDAERPVLSARGDLDGLGGDDVFLVDAGLGVGFMSNRLARPFLATGFTRPADIDGSGVVDFGDVTLLMLEFGPCPGCRADLDGSGVVDFGDVVLVLLDFG